MTEVGLDLANAHAIAVTDDYKESTGYIRGVLDVDLLTKYHHEVWDKYNIPHRYYGGTPFIGAKYEAHVVMPMLGLDNGFDK